MLSTISHSSFNASRETPPIKPRPARRSRRAVWARVRKGTGPVVGLLAMPPNFATGNVVVRAPSTAARAAATTPAGPTPITRTPITVRPPQEWHVLNGASRARGSGRTSRLRLREPQRPTGIGAGNEAAGHEDERARLRHGAGRACPKDGAAKAVATQLGAPGVPSFKNPTTADPTGIELIFSRGDPLGCALKRRRTHVGPGAQVSASRPGAGRALARDGGKSGGLFDIFRMNHRKSRLRRIDEPSLSMIGGVHAGRVD